MTCIIGMIDKGRVIMGADSAASDHHKIFTMKESKLFKKEDFLFGYCGDIRMAQLLKYQMKIPPIEEEQDVLEYLCTVFNKKIRKTFKKNGFALYSHEGYQRGAYFLIGYQGRLFWMEDNFQIIEIEGDTLAIGSGEEFAYGALHALRDSPVTPEEKIYRALEAASHHCITVAPPFTIESI